jgi:hypothetical protein
MNKKMIDEIRAEMAEIKAPGACKCCPITIYNHLFPIKLKVIGCTHKWNMLCELLGIEYSGVMDCIAFYNMFMGIKTCRFCRI